MSATQRTIFGKYGFEYLIPDLTEPQIKSFDWLIKEGITDLLSEISPIEDFTGKNLALNFLQHSFGDPKYSPEDAIEKGTTYSAPLRVKAQLVNKETGESMEQEVFLGDVPLMTTSGTFIINGVERVVVSQLTRSPGIFYTSEVEPATGRNLFRCELRPTRGSWLEFETAKNDVLSVRIDRKRRISATTLLRAIGYSTNDKIVELFTDTDTNSDHKYIETTLEKDPSKSSDEAFLEIYHRMRPGDPAILDNAKELLENLFFNSRRYQLGKVGRYKLNKKLGLDTVNDSGHWILEPRDIVEAVKLLIRLNNGGGHADDIDHLSNRRVRAVGELIQNTLRIGLLQMERVARERLSIATDVSLVTPVSLINARPVIARLNEFFGGSQLSQFMDQINSLSELEHLRRLSVMGPGGLTRERASFSVHDINNSQYGRICPIKSPEGPNIGLITHMSLFSRINEYGFLETPYRKALTDKSGKVQVTDQIDWLMADDEEKFYITHSGVNLDPAGYVLDQRVPVRHGGNFTTIPASNLNYVDVSPWQVFSASASLIPFLAHDDANRALMGANMQNQAVPLIKPSAPIVGTGMEKIVAENIGRIVKSPVDGTIDYVDGKRIVVKGEDKKVFEFKLSKFVKSNQNTAYTQKPLVNPGEKVKKGQTIADGPSTENGELALGQNVVLAYMSWEGYGFEDAIVISDRLVRDDALTSIHIEEYECPVTETKLGPEETTRDIPNVGEENLANLDDQGVVYLGAEVGPNDILVGKITPKGETELTAEERLLRAIFGEKAREVRDTSLRMPHGERGTIVSIQVLSREKADELDPGVQKLIKVKVAQTRKVTVGDKLAGRHGNKGVISKVVPVADMPYLEDGTPVDVIISPLSVISRMNLGQILEAHLGITAQKLNQKVSVPVFGGYKEEGLIEQFTKANLPIDGKVRVYNGNTGEAYDEKVVVGIGYIMKLVHMVDEKVHARSTGPYSLVTQQPLGGKAQMGGQRLGEMEVWALEAYGAAHTLQEMLTIKSDDVVGRAKAFEAIVKGVDIPESTVPESFKVLVKELNGLSLNVELIGAKEGKLGEETVTELKEEEKIKAEATELMEVSGAIQVAESDGVEPVGTPVEAEEVQSGLAKEEVKGE
ncbi:MAG: DNA-directed RNA polymerase subunit beta [Candidatus Woykebacteria bacterium RIFCSPHIGHO2_12_FULL_43_10]|uniref:DNA-directed RNA polymerase subunit beta n=2 Tax=Candidatus Woykeibacteriota TaxID=1817899 RepID=A0A1G1WXJ0_9BACT|nr:MAG: DNA-directed RNA polymerase subunit beta [Candidatus Woykebacteria bacterium RIFCSPHIGHO2_01_FULL_43_29]OGY28683.1 MAG: DNA-directed RNA polymerase subunit beta [Candidatus Woykebacteria bacterium RIFCSPHIGHO2_02_FULL_43_16b]OGY29759.1 MAG: DNA-directed RNA polymerase subunit beta [Candidatus Woykebacteria bacterium RIFCSPHIGHO2_12_FULL_43_10]OGY32433.1 MAG: DNA-directed RNA polymerase subunit beta [Candidatus Woykebacteria bacterium RIFCSPLOWO2_01_FULL_43_14]